MTNIRPLPYYNNDDYWGFAKTDGILSLDGERLLIEFQQKDSIIAAIKSKVQTVELPLREIASVEFNKKFFGSTLIFHSKNSRVFENIPGQDLTKRVFKIKREYRELAKQLVSLINIKLSEYKLDDLYD